MAELGQGEELLWISPLKVKLTERANCHQCASPYSTHAPLEIHDSPPFIMQAPLKSFCSQRAQEHNPHDIKTMQKHKDPSTIL